MTQTQYNFTMDNMRFEVIDENGRAYVKYGVDLKFLLQDDNRTLKVFVDKSERAEDLIKEHKENLTKDFKDMCDISEKEIIEILDDAEKKGII